MNCNTVCVEIAVPLSEDGYVFDVGSLYDHFRQLTDKRKAREAVCVASGPCVGGIGQVIRRRPSAWHCSMGAWASGYPVRAAGGESGNVAIAQHLLPATQLVRDYLGIKNGLHYRRDKTLREDATRMTNPALAEAMAIINNLIVGLTAQQG